ncbi:hypothetical protein D3C73_772930 [compost metagenome]
MVADAIGAPAQRQLRQVAGAQHEAAVLVGQAEQVVGAQARLDVLEGHVVHRLSIRERMADVAQHLFGGGTDVDLGPRHPERLHQRPGVGLGPLRGGEARQGETQNARPRQLQPVEGATGDQQRLGRIQPARDADHQALAVRRLHPAHQALDLDVEGLIAVLIQPGGIVRHEGEAVQRPDQGVVRAVSGLERDHRRGLALDAGAVGEGAVAQPVQADAVHVHVGDGQVAVQGEALALGQPGPQFMDGRLPVPGQVGGRLAPARGGENIGRQGAGRLAGAQQRALVGLADDDVGGRQVAEDAGARERRPRRGRLRGPEVLADLDREDEARPVGGLEDQARREIDALAIEQDGVLAAAGGWGEPALLIIFAIVGQIGLGDHAQHLAAAQHDGAVEQGVAVADRRADHGDHARRIRGFGQPRDLALDLLQQGRLQVQVVDGVGAQRQFGEDQQVHPLLARLADQPRVLLGVGGRIGDMDHRGRGGDAHEAMGARGVEGMRLRHQSFRSSRRTPGSSESREARRPISKTVRSI